jgi:hypothetical protein
MADTSNLEDATDDLLAAIAKGHSRRQRRFIRNLIISGVVSTAATVGLIVLANKDFGMKIDYDTDPDITQ